MRLNSLEKEVMSFIANGYSAKEIAELIHRAPKTVEKRVAVAKLKLNAKNIAHASALYVKDLNVAL